MTDFSNLIASRQSCRNFDVTKEVELKKLQKCADALCLSPSACNAQPYKFLIVTGEKAQMVRDGVTELGRNKFVCDCPAFAIVIEEKATLIPAIAAKFKSQDFAQIDIGIAATHYCLQATDLGLSTCILGWLNEEKLKKSFNIEKSKRIRLVLATGYAKADDELRPKKRKDISQLVEFI